MARLRRARPVVLAILSVSFGTAVAPEGVVYEREPPDRPHADHSLAGVSTEYLRTGAAVTQQEDRAAALLADAAVIEVSAPPSATSGSSLAVTVTVTNPVGRS